MSAKISASRRRAFLKALEETGNQTLAAEHAKVSRSWVVLHRKEHPEFDAAVRAAVETARQSLDGLRTSGKGSRKPPAGWGFLDGEVLVVRGSGGSGNGRRVQIARARLHQWCPRTEDRFLATLAATCNVRAACAEVGMTAASAYGHRKRWEAFAKRWDAAVETGYARIEMALIENASNLFSLDDFPADAPIPPMSAAEAVHLLHMHKYQVKQLGKRPGLRERQPSWEEVEAYFIRALNALRSEERVSKARKARDRRERALRRGPARQRPSPI